MGDHDVIHVLIEPTSCIVVCRCGDEFTGPNRVRAIDAHHAHAQRVIHQAAAIDGIAAARAALKGNR